jgi:hypothetical protein
MDTPTLEDMKHDLKLLGQIMSRVEQLSPASKGWLYDRLAVELGAKEA